MYSIVFFFQAEDGIRDLYVTGVQTCALPISDGAGRRRGDRARPRRRRVLRDAGSLPPHAGAARRGAGRGPRVDVPEIGRASCRERVWVSVVVVRDMKMNAAVSVAWGRCSVVM